jgi:hypothetical protein
MDSNPYAPPEASIGPATDSRPVSTRTAKVGAWLQLGLLMGIGATIKGMMNAFEVIETSGIGDPEKLSGAIGDVLIYTMIGFLAGLIGSILLGVAVFFQRCRARWVKVFFGLSLMPILLPALRALKQAVGL